MKIVVTVPTYNEVENIEGLVRAILEQDPAIEVLVADDDSPDGTAAVVRKLAAEDRRVHLLLRKQDRGRGRAGRDAFSWALDRKADLVFEMDADWSHHPRHLPDMIAALKESDVVLGSRQVPGGQDVGRPAWRRWLTAASNLYVRLLLGLPVSDCNSGYRGFRRHALMIIGVQNAFSPGPAIVHELLYKVHLRGQRITEIPIVFQEREQGTSTLSFSTLLRSYVSVLKLRWLALIGRLFAKET
ncbi:MAG: polyprenol monophosphomannose synthase [Planctomycetota bacterium]